MRYSTWPGCHLRKIISILIGAMNRILHLLLSTKALSKNYQPAKKTYQSTLSHFIRTKPHWSLVLFITFCCKSSCIFLIIFNHSFGLPSAHSRSFVIITNLINWLSGSRTFNFANLRQGCYLCATTVARTV